MIQEEGCMSKYWLFDCDRWLDAGEDDGETVREFINIFSQKYLLSYIS